MKRCPRWKKEQKDLWEEVWKETRKGREWWKVHELFAERTCSQALLDFLSSTDIGKIMPADPEGDDAESEASEWELRERAEQEEERRVEVETLGMEVEEPPLFLPTPPFMASEEGE